MSVNEFTFSKVASLQPANAEQLSCRTPIDG